MRDADSWNKIDYSAEAETWMKPLRKGNETGLICIPANWLVLRCNVCSLDIHPAVKPAQVLG